MKQRETASDPIKGRRYPGSGDGAQGRVILAERVGRFARARDPDGEAWLVSCDDGEPDQLEPVGPWREVNEAEARASPGWTRDGAGRYWLAASRDG